MASDEAERRLHARKAALTRSSRAPSGSAISAPAREAFLDKFYDQTDPELPEEERQRQARAALKLHMSNLSIKGVRARRRLQGAVDELIEVNEELNEAAGFTGDIAV